MRIGAVVGVLGDDARGTDLDLVEGEAALAGLGAHAPGVAVLFGDEPTQVKRLRGFCGFGSEFCEGVLVDGHLLPPDDVLARTKLWSFLA